MGYRLWIVYTEQIIRIVRIIVIESVCSNMAAEQLSAETEWDEVGFVISSDYRVTVLNHLSERPATPSTISQNTDVDMSHVSRALNELREQSLVELLVPEERKKGRIYGMTDHGADVVDTVEKVS